ncbi:MAG: zinc ribbon domain-containing protein [Candidatus Bathyarchaeia archaeon]|nr:zinc ribbon domain-containing protein [Candidatus Bathyarchaeota archaeon]
MANCEKCGLPLPIGAEYCPNCGVPVRKRVEAAVPVSAPLAKLIEAGLLGASIAIMISFFTPEGIDVYFIPSFLGAVGAIFLFRTRRLEEALVIAFSVYIFTDAIIAVLNLSSLYFSNMSWADMANEVPSLYDELYNVPSLITIIAYALDPISAVVAAYLGYKITPKHYAREPAPYKYERREDQGGIVYAAKGVETKPSANFTHNV